MYYHKEVLDMNIDLINNMNSNIDAINKNKNDNINNELWRTDRTFNECYTIDNIIQGGKFSEVFEGSCILTGLRVAVKKIYKNLLNEEDENAIHREVSIQKTLDHPNIIRLLDFFNEIEHYYIVQELAIGKDLFDRIQNKKRNNSDMPYTEEDAKELVCNLLIAIKYLHDKNIVHRDLKPENILMVDSHDDTTIKLCDFGYSISIADDNTYLSERCGTPLYMSPELYRTRTSYGKGVDLWALGVITYILLTGRPAYNPIYMTKRNFKLYHSRNYENLSDDAKSFINILLTVDEMRRATVDNALQHPWLSEAVLSRTTSTSQLTPMTETTLTSMSEEEMSISFDISRNYSMISVSIPEDEN